MKIAICDDNIKDLNEELELLKTHPSFNSFSISTFCSTTELYCACKEENINIVILDIEMPEPDGYTIAKKLKQLPKSPLIIFVTQSMEYTIQGYGLAFRYIPKIKLQDMFFPALDAAINELSPHQLPIFIDNQMHIINTNDIIFLESFGHSIVLHTYTEDFSFRGSLKELLKELPPIEFGIPHQSYIVNFKYVAKVSSTQIVLTTKNRIPISRRKSQNFNMLFHNYLKL